VRQIFARGSRRLLNSIRLKSNLPAKKALAMKAAPAQAAATEALLERYYRAFNAGDHTTMLACLADDVLHDVNQGERRTGKEKFRAFLARMDHCYGEKLENITLMVSADGLRAAAEFNVLGTYKNTDEGLPPANGQKYVLPAGTFFALSGGKITRVTTYYNLTDWLMQVTGEAM
jgi:steroid delta-isomerase-like uncharacterized protein